MKNDKIKIGTFIDETTKITGDIFAETNLKIDGIVDGNVTSSGDVIIGESAVITGNITARDLVISGRVSGDIKSQETITLTSKGKIEGNIQTTGFVVDIGSHFTGNCTILDGKQSAEPHKFVITAPTKDKANKEDSEVVDDDAVAQSVAASGDLLVQAQVEEQEIAEA